MKLSELKTKLIENQLASGEDPHRDDVAELLESGDPISPTVRHYIADIIRGNRRRRRGRPKRSSEEKYRRSLLAFEVKFRTECYRQDGIANARQQAIEDTADARGVSYGTLDKLVHPRR